MPSLTNILLCAAAALLFWTCLGWPIARRLAPERPLGLAMAPALGWAVYNAAALPILLLVGFNRLTVAGLCAAALLASLGAIAWGRTPSGIGARPNLPIWAFAAAIIALVPAIAIMPKAVAGGFILAEPIFDHSKVAIIDEMTRLGLPAGNPIFGEMGEPGRLAYYYLWHFGAATAALLLGVSGWEADIAMTWFTAFASLLLMMGLAVTFSGRKSAALWVALLSLSVSAMPVLARIIGDETLDGLLAPDQILQSWIVQASWVPQHLASATCLILALLLLFRIARGDRLMVPVLALVAASGFESSAWIGGVTFAVAAVPLGLLAAWSAGPKRRVTVAIDFTLAAILAAAIAFPILHDEASATAARGIGFPIAIRPRAVLGSAIPGSIRRFLDWPAFWLVFLVLRLPAIYLTGWLILWRVTTAKATLPGQRRLAAGFAILAAAALGVSWLLASTIANNDLGWRAILPGIMVLTVFAAIGLSRWLAAPAPLAGAIALMLFAIGLPDGVAFIGSTIGGRPSESAAAFAATPALWDRVRHYAGPGDRIANNPQFLRDMTSWPVNISWALLADRPSCFAGREMARAYVALPSAEIDRLEAFFTGVFSGAALPEDIRLMATRYGCRVVIVTASDPAWMDDPFARSAVYRLAEEKDGRWRIYVLREDAAGG